MISEEDLKREYVTAQEAAKMINVNNSRIRQICIEGKFTGAFKVGETWLIPRTSVLSYIPGKRGPKPKPPQSNEDREFLVNIVNTANNLKEDDNHDE